MEKLLSSGAIHRTVPDHFVFPPDKRPVRESVSEDQTLPVIDLGGSGCHVDGRDHLVTEILRVGKEFGFFQVVNHGIGPEIMKDMMTVTDEFFNMSNEDKAEYYSEDTSKTNRLFSSTIYGKDGPRYWRDCLRLACYPVDETINEWPEKPKNLREVLAKFIVEARRVAMELLNLIREGLGLKEGYFEGDVSGGHVLINANYYPPCPDPDLTLGLPPHCDRNLITLLLQGNVTGLQIKHKGDWIGVKPIENALVVNFGHQLEIITNGILKSVEHRAVTNSVVPRISVAVFIMPDMNSLIAPAEELVNENNPPIYKSFTFKDFLSIYKDVGAKREDVMDAFKIK